MFYESENEKLDRIKDGSQCNETDEQIKTWNGK